jgi:hypothetical protein
VNLAQWLTEKDSRIATAVKPEDPAGKEKCLHSMWNLTRRSKGIILFTEVLDTLNKQMLILSQFSNSCKRKTETQPVSLHMTFPKQSSFDLIKRECVSV